MRRALALAACLAAAPAGAQTMQDYVSPEGMRRFQLCRAAVFYHLDDRTRGTSTIPVAVARTLREQIEFLMQESIRNKPLPDLETGRAMIRFTEGWFIGFTEMLRDESDRLTDPAQRDAILYQCIPFIWVSMAPMINHLLAWRTKAEDAPPLSPPDVEAKRLEEALRALGR